MELRGLHEDTITNHNGQIHEHEGTIEELHITIKEHEDKFKHECDDLECKNWIYSQRLKDLQS